MPRIPWTIHRYLFREILQIFVLAIFAVSLLSTGVMAYQIVQKQALSIFVIWPLLLRLLFYPLFFSIPVALLTATTLAFGRLVAEKETMALQATGLPPVQLHVGPGLFAVLLCGLSFYLNGHVLPRIRYEKKNIGKYIARQIRGLGKGYDLRLPLPDGSLYCRRYDEGHLTDLRVFTRALGREARRGILGEDWDYPATIAAEEGRLEVASDGSELRLRIRAVEVYFESSDIDRRARSDGRPFFQQLRTASFRMVIPLADRTRSPADRTNREIEALVEEHEPALEASRAALREALPPVTARLDGDGLVEALSGQVAPAGALRDGLVWLADRATDPALAARLRNPGTEDLARLARALLEGLAEILGRPAPEQTDWDRLVAVVRESAAHRAVIDDARTERLRRYAFAFAPLFLPAIGIALALRMKSRTRLGPFIAGSLIVYSLFYPLLMLGEYLGEYGAMPELALILPDGALAAVALVMCWEAR